MDYALDACPIRRQGIVLMVGVTMRRTNSAELNVIVDTFPSYCHGAQPQPQPLFSIGEIPERSPKIISTTSLQGKASFGARFGAAFRVLYI